MDMADSKEGVDESLGWREEYRKRPLAFNLGAISIGFLVGYGLAAVLNDGDYYSEGGVEEIVTPPVPYAASQPVASQVEKASRIDSGRKGSEGPEKDRTEGPRWFERLKGTAAFERLEAEVGKLGDRFIDELSITAQTVVLPAMIAKLKEMIGIDLSDKEHPRFGRPERRKAQSSSKLS
jgi:hypothetical protein